MTTPPPHEYIFNWRLAKLMGLYQVLDPEAVRVFGQNVYHVVVFVCLLLPACAISALSPISLYRLSDNDVAFTFYLGTITDLTFSIYQMIIIMRRSGIFWRCIDVSLADFLTVYRRGYDKRVFQRWRQRTHRLTWSIAAAYVIIIGFWLITPYVFRDVVIKARQPDGTYGVYRMNVLNLYVMASAETYNEHFVAFHVFEQTLNMFMMFITVVFNLSSIMMFFAIGCQLQTISVAIETLGHEPRTENEFAAGTLFNRSNSLAVLLGRSLEKGICSVSHSFNDNRNSFR